MLKNHRTGIEEIVLNLIKNIYLKPSAEHSSPPIWGQVKLSSLIISIHIVLSASQCKKARERKREGKEIRKCETIFLCR